LLAALFPQAASAQIGATKEQVEARHLEPDFEFRYNLSPDGHVIFENWYSEPYHSAKVALRKSQPNDGRQ
jgi:hypothetical protein